MAEIIRELGYSHAVMHLAHFRWKGYDVCYTKGEKYEDLGLSHSYLMIFKNLRVFEWKGIRKISFLTIPPHSQLIPQPRRRSVRLHSLLFPYKF